MLPADASSPITRLLTEWRAGRPGAFDEAAALVYAELRRLAARALRRERAGHTLQATDLVHEAFVRLLSQEPPELQNRAHFVALAAMKMRQVLVDHARRRRRLKRGGGTIVQVPAIDADATPPDASVDLLDLDAALRELAAFDERKSRILEMHFFGEMTFEEIAAVLGVHVNTVARDARLARAWLLDRLRPSGAPPG